MPRPVHTTRDVYLASFVISEGGVLVDVKRVGPKTVEFRFAADRRLHQLLRLYWSGEPVWVEPEALFSAFRELKSLGRAPMIALTDQDVAEFGELYFRETGRRLPPEHCLAVAERLVELVGRLDELRGCPDPLPQSPS